MLAISGLTAYNELMEISFPPELETKLKQIASQSGKGANQLVQELVANYLEHDDWFRREVKKGVASLDSGKAISHEEVRHQMDRILGSK
jgi:predicted transcriptional regulator